MLSPGRYQKPERGGLWICALLSSCGSDGASLGATECALPEAAVAPAAPTEITLPPEAGKFDYQLGCAYAVPSGVSVVSRDRSAPADSSAFSICYVNAFQTQPDDDWSGGRDALLLRDRRGRKLRDPDWPDEYFLDLSAPSKRAELVAIVGSWLVECASNGFDAVELDNLDSFTRTGGLLTLEHTVAYARELLTVAHANHLSVAQKNAATESALFRELGFDFVVAEQCWEYEGDCAAYTDHYGARVFDVEYDEAAFERGCRAGRAPQPILRDLELVAPGPRYVRRQCP